MYLTFIITVITRPAENQKWDKWGFQDGSARFLKSQQSSHCTVHLGRHIGRVVSNITGQILLLAFQIVVQFLEDIKWTCWSLWCLNAHRLVCHCSVLHIMHCSLTTLSGLSCSSAEPLWWGPEGDLLEGDDRLLSFSCTHSNRYSSFEILMQHGFTLSQKIILGFSGLELSIPASGKMV